LFTSPDGVENQSFVESDEALELELRIRAVNLKRIQRRREDRNEPTDVDNQQSARRQARVA
jgi:hypothetical protein